MAAVQPRSYEKYDKYINRRNGKKKGRGGKLLLLLVILAVSVLIYRSRVCVVKEVEVTGNSAYSQAEIAGLSGISLGMSIFQVDSDVIERNFSSNAYVELLETEIEYPDKVILAIRERIPRAAINCAGVILLTDEEGFILERRTTLPDDDEVIVISGIESSVNSKSKYIESSMAGQIELMEKMLRMFREEQVGHLIAELNIANPDNLYLISQTGIQVILGDEENMPVKFVWMKAVLEDLMRNGVMKGVVDVSSGKNAVYSVR